jgi:integrase
LPTIELTGRTATGLTCPAGMTEITYWAKALPGFGLRIRSTGVRSWVAMARLKGSYRITKATFGDAGTVKFAEAFNAAREWLSAIRRGHDPNAEARLRKQAITVDALIQQYLAHQQRAVKPRTFVELRRHLLVSVKPLHRKRATELTRRDVVELLQRIAVDAPVQANRVRSNLSAMFAWGMKAGLVPSNPIIATFIPTEERPRERALSDDEIVRVWQCTEGRGDYGLIVRLLLLTGARRSEIGGMCDSELTRHADGSITWVLPGARSKNGLANELMLPPWTASFIPPAPRSGDECGLLFGDGADGFNDFHKSKARLDKLIANSGGTMPAWRLHDIRRTVVTKLNDLGIEPHVVESLINHVSGKAKGGVAGVYNRSAYSAQKKAALVLWADHVRALVEENIVPFKRVG